MTPQLAARLTIHEDAVARQQAAAPVVSLDGRRGRAADGADRALPILARREALHRRLLGAMDMLGATLALVVIATLAGGELPNTAVAAGVPLVFLFKVAGLYDRDQMRIVHSTLDEAPLLVQLTGVYTLCVTMAVPVLLDRRLDVVEIAGLWLASFVAIMGGRMVARWLAGRISPPERCLVVGDPERAARVREKLVSSHARAVVVATLPLSTDEADEIGSEDAFRRLVGSLGVQRVIVASATTDATGVGKLIRAAKAAGVRVSILPRMLEFVGSAVEFDDVDGMTMLGVRPFGLPRSSRLLKRAFDLAGSLVGLVAAGPLIALIALAVRVESKGPIFFRQVRVGRDGRHFRIYKFRSMVVDAEEQKDRLRDRNEVGDGMFKITDDPRVTRIGAILRATSLDELPQLFNVVRGEMSLVGPRPLVTDEDAQVLGLDRSRLHLTPGMTGPWQVLGSRVPMQEMVGIDYLYVAGWSLWLDLKILVRTGRHVLRSRNV